MKSSQFMFLCPAPKPCPSRVPTLLGKHMVWARYVVDQGGVDVGEDETVGANDGVGADIEGDVGLAMGVGTKLATAYDQPSLGGVYTFDLYIYY